MLEKARFHLICSVVVQQFLHDARTVATVPYSQFRQLLREQKISEVEIVADTLQGTLKEPKPESSAL
jgi:cell division protease FtsH